MKYVIMLDVSVLTFKNLKDVKLAAMLAEMSLDSLQYQRIRIFSGLKYSAV